MTLVGTTFDIFVVNPPEKLADMLSVKIYNFATPKKTELLKKDIPLNQESW